MYCTECRVLLIINNSQCSQLTLSGILRDLNDEFPKLTGGFHVLEESIDGVEIEALDHTGNDDLCFLRPDEVDHVLELLSGTHGRALDFDIFDYGLHQERHLW